MIVDWLPDGEQAMSIRRGCRTSATQLESCLEGTLTGMRYKDCYVACTGDGCNDDLAVEDLMSKKDEQGVPVELSFGLWINLAFFSIV